MHCGHGKSLTVLVKKRAPHNRSQSVRPAQI